MVDACIRFVSQLIQFHSELPALDTFGADEIVLTLLQIETLTNKVKAWLLRRSTESLRAVYIKCVEPIFILVCTFFCKARHHNQWRMTSIFFHLGLHKEKIVIWPLKFLSPICIRLASFSSPTYKSLWNSTCWKAVRAFLYMERGQMAWPSISDPGTLFHFWRVFDFA